MNGGVAEGIKCANKAGQRWNAHLTVIYGYFCWYMQASKYVAFRYLIFYNPNPP